MHDLVVIVGRSADVTRDVMPDEENPGSLETLFPVCLRVGTSFGGQFYVVEETRHIIRVLEGPFRTRQGATDALQLHQGRSLRPAS
jgi:hypothetical protein